MSFTSDQVREIWTANYATASAAIGLALEYRIDGGPVMPVNVERKRASVRVLADEGTKRMVTAGEWSAYRQWVAVQRGRQPIKGERSRTVVVGVEPDIPTRYAGRRRSA